MHLVSRRVLMILIAAMVCFPLVGCSSGGKSTVRGRVVTGSVGQAVAVSPEDERLEEDGIPGMKVVVMSKGGSASQGRGVYARATSDEFGDFELVFPGGTFPSDMVTIQVTGDGVFTARSTTYMPTQGGSLLCIVIPRPGYVRPEQNRESE